ncbi:MAG: hypothetical protein HC880_00935, partial [Bacteroidia bacterium]|nr:hypothetical protein [Bacteroidia bacterium]
MVLFYAMGGGLGHLTRAVSFMHTLSLDSSQIRLLSASPYARPPFLPEKIQSLQVPTGLDQEPGHYRRWLETLVQTHQIREVYLDAFPAGILGEWNDFPGQLRFHYLARILHWPRYKRLLGNHPPQIHTTYLLEVLPADQQAFIHRNAQQVLKLNLLDPPASSSPAELYPDLAAWATGPRPAWLIVHSEPSAEVEALIDYAQQCCGIEQISPDCLVISQRPTLTCA